MARSHRVKMKPKQRKASDSKFNTWSHHDATENKYIRNPAQPPWLFSLLTIHSAFARIHKSSVKCDSKLGFRFSRTSSHSIINVKVSQKNRTNHFLEIHNDLCRAKYRVTGTLFERLYFLSPAEKVVASSKERRERMAVWCFYYYKIYESNGAVPIGFLARLDGYSCTSHARSPQDTRKWQVFRPISSTSPK